MSIFLGLLTVFAAVLAMIGLFVCMYIGSMWWDDHSYRMDQKRVAEREYLKSLGKGS